MNLILVHGNFQDAILKKISEIKKNFDLLSVTEIPEGTSEKDLVSQSLFSNKRLVILENPDLKIVEQAILRDDENLTIVIMFSRGLEKASPVLKKILEAKGEILNFDEVSQASVFPFLDMIGNLNKKALIEFEKNYTEYGGQYILSMLAYFLRRMVVNKSPSSFMRQKIEAQKKNFSLGNIEHLYREIIETDFKIKSGFIDEKNAITLLVHKILRDSSNF